MDHTQRFYLVTRSKGGVGKTLATCAQLDELVIARDGKPSLFETDTSNPDGAKSYSGPLGPKS
jgi:hypothetical protein